MNIPCLTVQEVAEITRHHKGTVYQWIREGLPYLRKNGIRIAVEDLDGWLKRYKRLQEQDYEDN